MTKEPEVLHLTIPEHLDGQRLDRALAELLPEYSRSRLQAWIRESRVEMNGLSPRPRDPAPKGGTVVIRPQWEAADEVLPQPVDFEVVHQDPDLLVANKPAGLVVHPGAGNPDRTLQNGLLYFDPALAALPRAGMVHRLDKDTTGLLLIARSSRAHTALVRAMQARKIHREYVAVVRGVMTAGGRVEQPLGRHPVDRVRMAVRPDGRPAATEYRVLERFRAHTALRVWLETGRTHQIRVHMAWLRFPLVGDPVYGRKGDVARVSSGLRGELDGFGRQALHAARLRLEHPVSGENLEFQTPLPSDMRDLLEALRADG